MGIARVCLHATGNLEAQDHLSGRTVAAEHLALAVGEPHGSALAHGMHLHNHDEVHV